MQLRRERVVAYTNWSTLKVAGYVQLTAVVSI